MNGKGKHWIRFVIWDYEDKRTKNTLLLICSPTHAHAHAQIEIDR